MALSLRPGLRIAAERPAHSRSCVIYAWDESQSIHVDTLKSVPLEPLAVLEPFMTITVEEGQKLFDALWDMGYRKEGKSDDAGEIRAHKKHIKSLREICHFHSELLMRIAPLQAIYSDPDEQ